MHKNLLQVILFLVIALWWNVNCTKIDVICPRMYQKVYDGYAPNGNRTAGEYKPIEEGKDIESCVMHCCENKNYCNVAFLFNRTCYHVQCFSDEQCLPLKRLGINEPMKMVLVSPTKDISWADTLKLSKVRELYQSQDQIDLNEDAGFRARLPYQGIMETPLFGNRLPYEDAYETYDNDMAMDGSKIAMYREAMRCDPNGKLPICPENERCLQFTKNPFGICDCIYGYARNKQMKCVPEDVDGKLTEEILRTKTLSDERLAGKPKEENVGIKKLSVSVISKTVQLPEKKAALAAFPVPDEDTNGVKYNYTWTLISQPTGDNNGTISGKTKKKIEMQNLSEGVYQFKVIVSGEGWLGEAFANVTVLPERRINKAPIVRITPEQQIIKEPTNLAILDGSTSKDDDNIKSWHWDLVEGPINYQPILSEISTLQLTNLTLPGNYTFRLTVTDSDGKSNSTTARITVLKATDYPPNANAGHDVIVELPENSVTLDGTSSSDDHEIVAWEWTKSSDSSKAVDMQDTRTPFLKLSNLEEGIYTFVLKVTDASNQSNIASVRVFVKPPTNKPPKASAGQNVTISLPQNWVMLNATDSTDDGKIMKYEWTQINGPSIANINNKNSVLTNATDMKLGTYTFQVFVYDDGKKNATANFSVTVVQERNTAPVAHAGGDQSITLPVKSIYMNGSTSSDDLGIEKFEWIRDSSSLAVGTVLANSDHEPVLILTNVVPGRYAFKLTVYDGQGLSSSDTVSVMVHPDPLLMSLVEVTFSVNVETFTQSELDSLQQKLILLLGNNLKLIVRDLVMEPKTKEAVLIFYVERITGSKDNEILLGIDVERMLNDKMWRGSNIVGAPISDIRTSVCQNKCSGHGGCNSETRACMCETFWMPSVYYFWGLSEANCDWSILYVVIGTFILFIVISTMCWVLTCYCRRQTKPRMRIKSQKYSLLESHDNGAPVLNRNNSLSESGTDSDVLFESQSNSNGLPRMKNGSLKNGKSRYTITRLGRRIKA